MAVMSPRTYKAFLSYSHHDSAIAVKFHRKIEAYRLPRDLANEARLPKNVVYPVFRDSDEIASSASLPDTIRQALECSEYLIVLCSPAAASSRWVNEEIRFFRETVGADKIRSVLIDGDVPSCFPPMLLDCLEEPFAPDLRAGQDGLNDGILKTIAGISGLSYGLLKNREAARQRKRVRIQGGIAAFFAVLVSVTVLLAWLAARETRRAEFNRDQSLIALGESYLQEDKPGKALAFAWLVASSETSPQGNRKAASLLYRARDKLAWLKTISAHDSAAESVRYSSNGKRIYTSGGSDSTVRTWDAKKGELIHSLSVGTDDVRVVVSSDDDRFLITAGARDGVAYMWSTESYKLVKELASHRSNIMSLDINNTGDKLLTCSLDNTVALWNIPSGNLVSGISRDDGSYCNSVAFSPDGSWFIDGGSSGTAFIRDLRTGQQLLQLERHNSGIRMVAVSPDGGTTLTGAENGTVRLWDSQTGQNLRTLTGHGGAILSAVFSPDGKHLLTGSADGTARLWESKTGRLALVVQGHKGWVTGVDISPDGRTAVTAGLDGTVRLWDVYSNIARSVLVEDKVPMYATAFSIDGRYILSGGADMMVRLWSADSGKLVKVMSGHRSPVSSVAFSPDALFAVSGEHGSTVKVWSTKSGVELGEIDQLKGSITHVEFSKDGRKILAADSDGTLILTRIVGKEVHSAEILKEDVRVMDAQLTPDGLSAFIALGGPTAQIWNSQSNQIHYVEHPPGTTLASITRSNDGKLFATGDFDGVIRLFDTTERKLIYLIEGHDNIVSGLSFSADGRMLVSSSMDGTAKLWDVELGMERLSFAGHTGPVVHADLSPDGKKLLTAGNDGKIQIWNIERVHKTNSKSFSENVVDTYDILRELRPLTESDCAEVGVHDRDLC